MDRAFGKLRDALGTLGIRDNTILWYCSDNGALRRVGSAGPFRGHKGQVYEGGLLVPAILEWPARINRHRVVEARCNTCDIYPTLLDLVDAEVKDQPPLDGVSLAPLVEGTMDGRPRPMGFWNYPAKGIGTPSAQWMGALLTAQKLGGDLPPHASSQRAARLPKPPFPLDRFRGHAAWIDGDWKLHRIENQMGKLRWELYNLAVDPGETKNVVDAEAKRVEQMQSDLNQWLQSVTRSLNGEDYAKR